LALIEPGEPYPYKPIDADSIVTNGGTFMVVKTNPIPAFVKEVPAQSFPDPSPL
jgi:hypothetical protein